MTEVGRLTESAAAEIAFQLLSSIAYLHANGEHIEVDTLLVGGCCVGAATALHALMLEGFRICTNAPRCLVVGRDMQQRPKAGEHLDGG